MKQKYTVSIVGVCVFLVIVSSGVVIHHLTITDPTPQNPEQQRQYTLNQGVILLTKQMLQLERLKRQIFWVHAMPYLYLVGVVLLLGGGMGVLYRCTRPTIEVALEQKNGQHTITKIPIIKSTVRERQMVAFAPLAHSLATFQDDAFKRSLDIWNAFVNATRSIKMTAPVPIPEKGESVGFPYILDGVVPTFRHLLQQGEIAPGNPLIMGYNGGKPEYRDLSAIKSLGVGGLQGSGKTWSAAFFLGSALYAYNAEGFLLDPHGGHNKSLTARISPLIQQGFVRKINPLDTKLFLEQLDTRLDCRLDGKEPCEPAIIVVFDELSRLFKAATKDIQTILIRFLERCTEETRKGGIIFCGISPKWNARHFGNRADIRGCLNSVLVHKMKSSQAKFLLEEPEEKKMLKSISKPGEGILITDYSGPIQVSMPVCTKQDFQWLADAMASSQKTIDVTASLSTSSPLLDAQAIQEHIREIKQSQPLGLKDIYQKLCPDMMSFETFRKKYQQPNVRSWGKQERQRLSERLPALREVNKP